MCPWFSWKSQSCLIDTYFEINCGQGVISFENYNLQSIKNSEHIKFNNLNSQLRQTNFEWTYLRVIASSRLGFWSSISLFHDPHLLVKCFGGLVWSCRVLLMWSDGQVPKPVVQCSEVMVWSYWSPLVVRGLRSQLNGLMF